MASLYQINKEISEIFTEIVDPETGDFKGEEIDIEKLNNLNMDLHQKMLNVGKFIKNEKALSSGIGDEIRKLQARKKTHDNRIKRLKDYLLNYGDGEKVEDAQCIVRFTKGSESVHVIQEALLPREYVKTTYTPDKTAIKQALKSGKEVKGAELVRKPGVVIK